MKVQSNSPEPYSLEQVRSYMLAEHPAVHGLSPLVHDQNQIILGLLSVGAELMGPGILGAQLIGSRAHGSAAPESDVDLICLYYDDAPFGLSANFRARLRGPLIRAGIDVDNGLAGVVQDVSACVPKSSVQFIESVQSDPLSMVGLFERGAYDSVNLRLGALTAAHVISYGVNEPEAIWGRIRDKHANVYLGTLERLHTKLRARLSDSPQAIGAVFDEDFRRQRVDRLGLPRSFDDYYSQATEWYRAQNFDSSAERGLAIHESVVRELQRSK